MDQTNYDYVAQLMRSRPSSAKLLKVREFDPQETDAPDLPDPYSGGMDGFELVYEQLDRSLDVFIEHLKEKHSLVVPN
jgi:protein-tyrosine phosphatase